MSIQAFDLDLYLEELKALINIDCGSTTPEGIASIADLMTEKYESIGWQVSRIHLDDKAGPALLATNNPNATQYDLMLVGHMDTVFPEGTVAEWSFSRDEKQAYGPGVADMKSGLLNVFLAVKSLPVDVKDKLDIVVCMNPDEEIGSIYSKSLIEETARKSRHVIVAEAARADGSLVEARKGSAVYEISFQGKAAHAGNEPQNGISAITEMAHWITRLNQETNFETGTTLNFGTVSGGAGSNIVPEHASTVLDIRFWNNDDYAELQQLISSLVENPFLSGMQTQVERISYKPAFQQTEESKAFIELIEATGEDMGLPITWQSVGGGSDANHTGALGISTVDGLGPIGGGMHSRKEFLVLNSIEPRLNLLRNVMINLAERA